MTDDIEDIRQKKLEQLKEKQQSEQQQSAKSDHKVTEEAVLKQALTSDARRRLNTAEMARPEVVQQVKTYLVRAYQMNQIQEKISEQQIREILSDATEQTTTSYDIQR